MFFSKLKARAAATEADTARLLADLCFLSGETNQHALRRLPLQTGLTEALGEQVLRQFSQADLVTVIASILDETGVDPAQLDLEITGSVAMQDADSAIAALRQARVMDISLAIDDFGTGYSSLSYLKRFPIDRLKIDRSFIQSVPEDNDDTAIVRAIAAMAGSLKLELLAEGVETEARREFLQSVGCNLTQGYLFGRPMLAAEFEQTALRPNESHKEKDREHQH